MLKCKIVKKILFEFNFCKNFIEIFQLIFCLSISQRNLAYSLPFNFTKKSDIYIYNENGNNDYLAPFVLTLITKLIDIIKSDQKEILKKLNFINLR